ncbi:MAG: family 16 glycosylhydrolase [Flavobacteriales bacterium]|nr:family 16 glycosylhydrolase [Flavobacteriia bacterium]NCP04756.1 family 16 glycosylhydrolase [Flavobacteriales bacterium]PIV92645.1 MAG: beta-glucanase [Flavobacteriaceae bacterium CG17_big_fil_post_rev_8_21_14_2_50_33_15]PIY11107.1 MAG: beta-glucanase [Flavobacteriaceae bacterium CG_4_10_14_3_um_filter_33_47]PJB17792.1 MAG: beta-glucanase [Flavobacteriaceae bacterium CG_4_9_14_3_um_filter_33_16]
MRNFYSSILIIFLFLSQISFSQQMPIDFSEATETFNVWGGSSFSLRNSPSNANNKVGEFYHAPTVAQQGFYIDLSRSIDLDFQNSITLLFYAFDPNIHTVTLKLERGANTDVLVNVNTPSSQENWVPLTFNFSGASGTYDRLTILIDNGNATPGTFLIDDIDDGSTPVVLPPDPVYDYLVWSDEFDGSGAINTTNWFHQTIPIINGQSWANGEIQHYTDRTTNSYLENGSLKILAKKETYTNLGVTKQYTSARLNSKFAFTYGKVEIRAKMPFGVGTFPALWMLGQNITETGGYWAATHGTTSWPDCGEIDIIEHWGENQDFVQSALHNRSSFGGTINKGGRLISNASTEFHIYTLDWNSNKMTFSVDGIAHYVYNPVSKNIQNWPYNAPQYLLFNVAILPNIASNFTESAMEIDYVRVFQEGTLSIEETPLNKLIKVYPNPAQDYLYIDSKVAINKISFYNMFGMQVLKNASLENNSIDISELSSGIYLLEIVSDSKKTIKKVVIN